MTAPRALRDFALAVTQLTFVPLRVSWPTDERPDLAPWYPWVGLLLGGFLVGTTWLADLIAGPEIVALAGILVLALATRLFHWDGLADVADAWFAPRERRAEIMRDSRTGAFGAFGVAFVLLTYFVLMDSLFSTADTPLWGLLCVTVFGRLSATFAAWFGTPLRSDGLGAAVISRPSVAGALVGTAGAITTAVLAVSLGGLSVWLPVGCTVIALALPHLISLRIGGVTGDVMGASVILSEVGVLMMLSLDRTLTGLMG